VRLPASPPDFGELVARYLRRGGGITGKVLSVPANQPYWHWDELRHRTPPADMSHDQWWLATKLVRSSTYRTLPLRDHQGGQFVYSLPDEVLRETDFINTNASGRITLSEQVTDPATRDEYLVSSLIEEATTSSQLEGASTTRRVAKDLIRSGRPPRDRSERMVLNNFMAMERVSELRSEALSPELVCEIHRIVTDGTLDDPDAAGRYQSSSETRVGVFDDRGGLPYLPPPAEEIPDRVAELCAFANGKDSGSYLPGVLRALAIHFTVGFIHPFEDGNGRTARALFYWSMLNQGYWLTEFLSVSSLLKRAAARYGRSFLHTETDGNDLTYFFIYHLGILHRAVDALHEYLRSQMSEAKAVRKMLADAADHFNTRQVALLRNALQRAEARYTVQSHMRSHRVAMETARKDLAELADLGLLTRIRTGKHHTYSPAPRMDHAISQVARVLASR
jgi:Fic family protein